jgi:hypothetical protein
MGSVQVLEADRHLPRAQNEISEKNCYPKNNEAGALPAKALKSAPAGPRTLSLRSMLGL